MAEGAVRVGWPAGSALITTKPLLFNGNGEKYVGYVPLTNPGGKPQCVSVDARLQAADGAALETKVVPWNQPSINAYDNVVQEVTLTFTQPVPTPASGLLRVFSQDVPTGADGKEQPCAQSASDAEAKKVKPAVQEIRIPEGPLMGYIFVGAFVTAFLVSGITGFSLKSKGIGVFRVMGGTNWTFEKSWGVNVTLGSALLVTLIGLTIFPDRPRLMTKMSYSILQILFGALVSLAPLVYNLIRREVQVNNANTWGVNIQGYVIMFLIAGGLVLWAAMGQVATLAVLTEEFVRAGALDAYSARTLQGLAVLLFLLLLMYGFRSLYQTAKTVSATPTAVGGPRPGPQPAAAVDGLPTPMSEWSIL